MVEWLYPSKIQNTKNIKKEEMIKTVIIDVDGVLTDGKVWYNSKGERSKGFHSRDIRAIRELVAHGFDVILYTQSTWPGMEDYAARTGATVVMNREKIPLNTPYIAIGDDTPDLDILHFAQRAFCPSDADPMVRSLQDITILETKGGEGCVAEMLHHGITVVGIKQLAVDTETIDRMAESASKLAEVARFMEGGGLRYGVVDQEGDLLIPGCLQEKYHPVAGLNLRSQNISLALNDPQHPCEYETWKKYIDQIVNQEEVKERGYFWVVSKAVIKSVGVDTNDYAKWKSG